MANMASVAYAIEGPQEVLEQIQQAINKAIPDKDHWSEWKACEFLGFPESQLRNYRLGGEISEEPTIKDGVMRFYAEERWGLQDFEELLRQKFPDIKVYWVVEESGCEVYCTNDKEGKYFPERYYVELSLDDQIEMEYFKTEEDMFQWLFKKTDGRVKNWQNVEDFNSDYEDEALDDENYIIIHQFDVCD